MTISYCMYFLNLISLVTLSSLGIYKYINLIFLIWETGDYFPLDVLILMFRVTEAVIGLTDLWWKQAAGSRGLGGCVIF